jgi:UDP-N-acetylmuramoylalanine--D-glutamate ligase
MLNRIKNKKIAILGYGIENQALVQFLLSKKIKCNITICDARLIKDKKIKNVKWQLGKNYDKNLDKFDIISRVAGYPLFTPQIKKAKKKGVEISSPSKLFFEICPTKNIIGVTGTKGKGTVSGLIYEILKLAKKQVYWGGNIGIPMFSLINKIKKNDWVVLELSSFQLEDMKISPHIAVLNNFTREHLAPADPLNPNYHKTMANYWRAKANIFKWQKKGDLLIVNRKLKNKIKNHKSKIITFKKSNLESQLVGEHNKENIAAAQVVSELVGIKPEIIKKAVQNFKGLEHRIEFVAQKKGIKYYNDSFATTPEASITALESFTAPIILLAGGAEKKSDFKILARVIKKQAKFVVLLNGKTTPRIKKELTKIGYHNTKLVHNTKEAFRIINTKTQKGDVVLLSPACASFGMFRNYKERGKLFKQEVKKL